jgi:hypothetical protein
MDNLLVPGRELSRLLGISGDLDPIDPAASIAREVRYKDGNGAAVF